MLAAASSVHAVRWANALHDLGHAIHLVTQHPPSDRLRPGITVHGLPHLRGLGYLTNGNAVAALVAQVAPDVVNVHYATGYGTLARSVRGVPVVLNIWGSDVYDFPEKGPLHRWWLRRNLRYADRVLSTSRAMAHRAEEICPGLKIAGITPFGVDTALFSPGPISVRAPLTIGTVKSLAPPYGVDTLIRAFALITRDPAAPQLRLRIVGDGPERRNLIALAQREGVHELTEFVGPVPHDRVPQELRKLDVAVALSRSESFGVAVIEASACGLPVIVSAVGGLPEVVRDGITGFLVPPDDPSAAAAAIRRLVDDSALRAQMGKAGRAFVIQEYDWSQCVGRLVDQLSGACVR